MYALLLLLLLRVLMHAASWSCCWSLASCGCCCSQCGSYSQRLLPIIWWCGVLECATLTMVWLWLKVIKLMLLVCAAGGCLWQLLRVRSRVVRMFWRQ
jgi:hypothetical protein